MPALHYHVAMPVPASHRFHVTVTVEGWEADVATFRLPTWTPGSYLIREFARHLERFEALSGEASLPSQRRDKATWEVQTAGHATFQVRYEVYAFEWTVRTSHLTTDHGYFNGTNLLVYLEGTETLPTSLTIEPPQGRGWQVSLALPQDEDGRYLAPNYDVLVDSPAEIGTHSRFFFEVLGKPHELALFGSGNADPERLVSDLRVIVETAAEIFGGTLPYDRYLFIVHLSEGRGGGLEHLNSTTLLVDRWTFSPESEYQRFLRLAAHEFFHVWNVKRIRAAGLGPFDYTREVYTPLLWVMEGFTTYYDFLLVRRAGLASVSETLDLLAERIASYRAIPGRLIQTLVESSMTTWIKFYRPDENSVNSAISYYLKGSLVALMLDLEMRHLSGNSRSLDTLMLTLWERFGLRATGFTPEEFLATLNEVAGTDLSQMMTRYVEGLEELPLERTLAQAGLLLEGTETVVEAAAWLGLATENKEGRLQVKHVLRASPAELAGLSSGDELIALDGFRIKDAKYLTARLRERQPGETVTIHLFREGQLCARPVVLGAAPAENATILQAERPTALQRAIFESWMRASWREDFIADGNSGVIPLAERAEQLQ